MNYGKKLSVVILISTLTAIALSTAISGVMENKLKPETLRTMYEQNMVEEPTTALNRSGARVFTLTGPIMSVTPETLVEFDKAASEAQDANKRVLLVINSPGGRVDLMTTVLTIMMRHKNIDTYILGSGASAAAEIWSYGANKYVAEMGQLLFHSANMGQGADLYLIMELLNIIKDPKILGLLSAPSKTLNELNDYIRANFSQTQVDALAAITGGSVGLVVLKHHSLLDQLETIKSALNSSNQTGLNHLHKLHQEAGGTMTRNEFQVAVYGDFDLDRYYNKADLVTLRILTNTEEPDLSIYL